MTRLLLRKRRKPTHLGEVRPGDVRGIVDAVEAMQIAGTYLPREHGEMADMLAGSRHDHERLMALLDERGLSLSGG